MGSPVLSFVSDDDDLEFCCSAAPDGVERVCCLSGNLLFVWNRGQVTVETLSVEFDEDEEFAVDVSEFRKAFPEATVVEQERQMTGELHSQLRIELSRFLREPNTDVRIEDFNLMNEKLVQVEAS